MGITKQSRKIETIEKYIKNASGGYPAYAYGKIPRKKARVACQSYGGAIEFDDIIGLIDVSLFGDGSHGMIFTEYRVYFDNGLFGGSGSVSYQDIYDSEKIPSGAVEFPPYNRQAMIELLSELSDIEGGPGLTDIALGILDWISTENAEEDNANESDNYIDAEFTEKEYFDENDGYALESPEKRERNNLIQCVDCGKEISRRADKCPHCGCPVEVTISEWEKKKEE